MNARGSRGSYSTNSVGLDREGSHLVLEMKRPTSNSGYSWGRTDRHKGPMQRGRDAARNAVLSLILRLLGLASYPAPAQTYPHQGILELAGQ